MHGRGVLKQELRDPECRFDLYGDHQRLYETEMNICERRHLIFIIDKLKPLHIWWTDSMFYDLVVFSLAPSTMLPFGPNPDVEALQGGAGFSQDLLSIVSLDSSDKYMIITHHIAFNLME